MSSEPTVADLRRAMAAHTDGVQPAPELGRAVRARVSRQRWISAGIVAMTILAAGTVTAARVLSPARHNTAPGGPVTSITASPPSAVVLNYRKVCEAEGSVCASKTGSPDPLAGNVPSQMLRPLRFRTLASGQPCPTTSGARLDTANFGGIALGNGPVRPVLAEALNDADALRGTADLLNPTSVPPWLGFNTLWISLPSYQGPFIVRAQRLDGPGTVMQGDAPNVAILVVPPGPTINSAQGWRTAPGGTWVKTPGCYAWQVDGLTFSYVIVVNAVLGSHS